MAQAKKRKVQAKRTKKSGNNNGIRLEIILCVILGISVLLLISNFGIGGMVGNAVSSFFFGIFGFMAYVFPFCLFFGAAFFLANKDNPLVIRKTVGAVLCFLFLCAFMQLIMDGYQKGTPIGDYYIISAKDKLGGGLFGGLVVLLFAFAFGIVGAYVLTVIGLVIGAIIMTQKPLLSQLKNRGTHAYREAKSGRQRRREVNASRPKPAAIRAKNPKQMEFSNLELGDKPEPAKEPAYSDVTPEFLINRGDMIQTEAATAESSAKQKPGKLPKINPVSSVDTPITKTEEEPGPTPFKPESNPRNPRSPKDEIESNIHNIQQEIQTETVKPKKQHKLPALSLLKAAGRKRGDSDRHLRETAAKLQQTLHNFGVNVTVTNASCGPTVTRYELQPEQGVKVSKIVSLTDDIKLNLAASDIRIEAPIPGKAAVGIEVPNEENTAVMLRELLQSDIFVNTRASLPFAVGKDIAGKAVVADIARMPHLLIAGATGSGKSVCINTLIMSLLYKANPEDVKLIMIDPKVVELSVYNGIPHLMIPVVTDPKKAAGALNWAVAEMTERYNTFADFNVRDLKSYNEKAKIMREDAGIPDEDKPKIMPQIVIIVDELADLMMVAPGEVEDAICRLAQLARAAGLHLIIATQRPSVNVITGLIKANMPSRIAFSVSSGVDSRTILDMNGAEKLLGKGDMLFYPQGYAKPARLQGAFVSDDEVLSVVKFLSSQQSEVVYNTEVETKINSGNLGGGPGAGGAGEHDAYFAEAGRFIIEKDKASIGMLQRVLKIGFNRAARIMDQLCEAGVVGEEEGTKPRKVLMSMEQFEQLVEELV